MSSTTLHLRAWIVERGSPVMGKQKVKGVVRESLFAAIKHWHTAIMPGHFTVRGGRKYNYQPRSGENEPALVPREMASMMTRGGKTFVARQKLNQKYYHKKLRKLGHSRPLVYSGNSEAAARSGIRLRGTSDQAKGLLSMPKYFYQYRKDLNAPDKADELTRTTLDEVEVLAQKARGHAIRTIASMRQTTRRRIA